MKTWIARVVSGALGVAFASGCIVVHPDGEGKGDEISRDLLSVSVHSERVDAIKPILSRSSSQTARFSVVCTGTFRVERTWSVQTKPVSCKSIAIGLFPGYLAMVDAGYGYGVATAKELLYAPFANACTGGLPTLLTLFAMPFRGNNSMCVANDPIIWSGLIGCYPYNGYRTWFRSSDNKNETMAEESTYVLDGYVVLINGVRYECPVGQKEVCVSIHSETNQVDVRFLSVPTFDGEFGRWVSSLAGSEFNMRIE